MEGPGLARAGSATVFWRRLEQRIRGPDAALPSMQIRYREAEGPRGLLRRFHELGRQWLQPGQRTKAQILDQVVLERLLTLLPPEAEHWVRGCGPESSAQAVALAEGLLGSRAAEAAQQQQQGALLENRVDFMEMEESSLDPSLCHGFAQLAQNTHVLELVATSIPSLRLRIR